MSPRGAVWGVNMPGPPPLTTAMNPEKKLGPVLRYRIDWDAPVSRDLRPA